MVTLAVLPGMLRISLVVANLANPGNSSKAINLLVSQPGIVGVAIYKALENLSPSSHGPVSVVEVGGRLAEWRMPMERRYKLKPSVRPLIRYARDRISESRPDDVMLVGKIRELDRDRNSFELREIASGKPNQRFSYEDAFLEDVLEGIGSENRFRVIGTREGPDDPYSVLAIRRDDEVKDIAEPAS